jgi:cytidine deaminase
VKLETSLLTAAVEARAHAYAPYSGFRVGAAIRTRSGAVYVGCNVENASYGATLCAERAAVAAMVAAGDTEPVACAVVTAGRELASPCGICRQVLAEFGLQGRRQRERADLKILLARVDDAGRIVARKSAHLSSLLPQAFRLTTPARRSPK